MRNFKKLFELLTKQDRVKMAWIVFFVFVVAILDVAGVASIMPFVAVLANPDIIFTNTYINAVFVFFEFDDVMDFLFFIGQIVFGVLVSSLALKAAVNYVLFRFVLHREYEIGCRLIVSYLNQPYDWFLAQNSAELGKSLLSEVNQVVRDGLLSMINVISQSILVITIIIFIMFINFYLAITIGLSLIVTFLFLFKITRAFLSRIGNARLLANDQRFRTVNELFGAIKEVKLASLERTYINRFRVPSKIYAEHQASAMVVAQLPRFALEGVAFGGMLGGILYVMQADAGFAETLPIFSAYAFAAYKLMPAFQSIYAGATLVSYTAAAVDALHSRLYMKAPRAIEMHGGKLPVTIQQGIEFRNISFKYDSAQKYALKNINLKIPAGNTVGIVGPSGSGKTTIVDILIGLLEPKSGFMSNDGSAISMSNMLEWQKKIGYVPQNIYLTDDTISANIAFGVEKHDIDYDDVIVAAKRASLHNYVSSELFYGYDTHVGERGARLSGGQRQRIGIARALYKNPSILILDEATSALDNLTEKSVMNSIHNMSGVTILVVSHRLSTIKKCDEIIFLNNGVIENVGTFEELLKNNQMFSKMADHETKKSTR